MHHRGVYLHDFIRDLLFSAQKKSLFPLKVLLLHAHCIVGLSWNTVKGDEHGARSLLKAKVFWFSGTLGSGAKTWICKVTSSLRIPNTFFVRQSTGHAGRWNLDLLAFCSGVDSRGAGGARAPQEFEGSEKGQSLISAFWSLAITASTPWIWKAIYAAAYS